MRSGIFVWTSKALAGHSTKPPARMPKRILRGNRRRSTTSPMRCSVPTAITHTLSFVVRYAHWGYWQPIVLLRHGDQWRVKLAGEGGRWHDLSPDGPARVYPK